MQFTETTVADRGIDYEPGTKGLDLTIEDTKVGCSIMGIGGTFSFGEAYKTAEGALNTVISFGKALVNETMNSSGDTSQKQPSPLF